MFKANTPSEKGIDMLHGSIYDKILLFAIPLVITGMLQQLFTATDVAIVGQFAGKEAMAGVGSNGPVVGLFVNLFIGISNGANVIIARYVGMGDKKRVSLGVHSAISFSVLAGILMAFVTFIFSRPMLNLLSVPSDVMPHALPYIRIYGFGMPIIFLYNFLASIYRSHGDTKTPLWALSLGGVLNVLFNLFFVRVLGMGAAGVAIATVIANFVSSTILFVGLLRRNDEFKFSFNKFAINFPVLKEMLGIGVPAGLNMIVYSISNLCVQSAINFLGSDVMAANSASMYIDIFSYMVFSSFSQAAATFTSQNYGFGNIKRCKRIGWVGLIWDLGISVTLCATIIAFGRPLIHLFNTDPVIVELAYFRLKILLITQFTNITTDYLAGVLRGYGQSLIPAVLSMAAICGTRILYINLFFYQAPSFERLMFVYPISWAIYFIILLPVFIVSTSRIFKRYPQASYTSLCNTKTKEL